MIPLPVPNTRAHPYRGLSVQEVDFPLTEEAVLDYLLGREVYRRTDYLALRSHGDTALVAVRKESLEPLFSPVVEARLLAGPDETAWVESPETDVGNSTSLAAAAVPGARRDRDPRPLRARQLHLGAGADHGAGHRGGPAVPAEAVRAGAAGDRVRRGPAAREPRARRRRRARPRRGQPGVGLPAAVPGIRAPSSVRRSSFLDTRPGERGDWTLIGCERSLQFHRHFYGDEPTAGRPVPAQARRGRARPHAGRDPHQVLPDRARAARSTATRAVVPWGTNLDEVREGLRHMLLPLAPEAVQGRRRPRQASTEGAEPALEGDRR